MLVYPFQLRNGRAHATISEPAGSIFQCVNALVDDLKECMLRPFCGLSAIFFLGYCFI